MARKKQTIIQRDFRFGVCRPDMLERHDTDLRASSLSDGLNMRLLATGGMQARDGFLWRGFQANAKAAPISVTPVASLEFGLLLMDTQALVLNETGGLVQTISPVPWASADDLWTADFGEDIVVGDSTGLWIINYDDGNWSVGDFSFEAGFGGAVAQPYWVFKKGTRITPDNYSGTVTITSTSPVFNANHVGARIRYLSREIELTEYVSPTMVRGTTVEDLPPTFFVNVATPSDFRIGDVVQGVDTGYEGIVEAIGGSTLTLNTLNYYNSGPNVSELLVSSSGTSGSGVAVTAKSTRSTPYGSSVWDEPMMSAARGYPRSGHAIGSRLVLCDFPEIVNGVAISSAREFRDFLVGSDDDMAIARQIGDSSERIFHVIDAGDLLFLSSRGLYQVPIAENGVLTPSNFAPVLFDKRGASPIRPVQVGDGVVFVEADGKTISSAALTGNVYRRWSVRSLTEMHSHLVRSPVDLCGPALNSQIPEKYVFVVNGDGTMATISFFENLDDPATVGIVPWDTDGTIISASPVFGTYWIMVDREVNGVTLRMLESIEEGLTVDSAVILSADQASTTLEVNGVTLEVNGEVLGINSAGLTHLAGEDVYVSAEGYAIGPLAVDVDGFLTDETGLSGERQIGRNYEAWARPWPVENIESPRTGTFTPRCIRFLMSVQDSDAFIVQCNGDSRRFGGYSFGADLGAAPETVTGDYAVPVFGRRHNPELYIRRTPTGRLRVLYLGQEVQV